MTTFRDARLPARFWAKVSVADSGCWLWTAARNPQTGYAVVRNGDRVVTSHRWAYLALVGEIAEGLVLDHLCRVRECVNPEHLEPVTDRMNILRGDGYTARAFKQTHCRRGGHPLFGPNLYRSPRGERRCRTCGRELRRLNRTGRVNR